MAPCSGERSSTSARRPGRGHPRGVEPRMRECSGMTPEPTVQDETTTRATTPRLTVSRVTTPTSKSASTTRVRRLPVAVSACEHGPCPGPHGPSRRRGIVRFVVRFPCPFMVSKGRTPPLNVTQACGLTPPDGCCPAAACPLHAGGRRFESCTAHVRSELSQRRREPTLLILLEGGDMLL